MVKSQLTPSFVTNARHNQRHQSSCLCGLFLRAFTLVEVLIALVLILAILGIVSVSVDIYLRQMVVNRSETEEAQLARAILFKLSQELRGTIGGNEQQQETQETQDIELLQSIFGTTNSENTATAAPTTAAPATETSSIAGLSSELSGEELGLQGVLSGIYGEQSWIQIDTTRIPRGEYYAARKKRTGSQFRTDRLSASKTVYYYLGKDTGTITNTDDPRYKPDKLIGSLGRVTDLSAVKYGLFRREFDRQVTQYINNEGKEDEYEQDDEVIAPEVEWIEFAYFDPNPTTSTTSSGSSTTSSTSSTTSSISSTTLIGEWVDYWDMDEKQSLPKAIKITIAIRREVYGNGLVGQQQSATETTPTNIYSAIVLLPIQPATNNTNEETTEEE
ncbi:MAG: prepilin-type N-terminal cleavage/methylation domain-containing protein [Planctomycetaceae bacterium]|jgi:type II secretory pathway pseudopilin PulG|nr:prepilin-type N-terminal cleavage/methylation domain-containing protein [Planctomycetaceae bacterium]